MVSSSSEFLVDFIEESMMALKQAEFEIVEIENRPADKELLNSVFRCYHSIKGSAGFLRLEPIVQLTHTVENVLDGLKKGQRQVYPDLISLILRANDRVQAQLECLTVDPESLETTAEDQLLIDQINASNHESSKTDLIKQSEDMLSKMSMVFSAMKQKGINAKANPELRNILGLIDNAIEKIDIERQKRPVNFDCTVNSIDYSPHTKIVFSAIDKMRERKVTDDLLVEVEDALKAIKPVFEGTEHEPAFVITKQRLSDFKVSWKILDDALYQEVFNDFYTQFLDIMHRGFIATYEIPPQYRKKTPKEAVSKPEETTQKKPSIEKFIRIHQDKLDEFMDQVGELIITTDIFNYVLTNIQSRNEMDATLRNFKAAIIQLEELSTDMQVSIMEIRKIPLTNLFKKFTRLVREVSSQAGKKAQIELIGDDTEIDKNMVELIEDPLVHLLRNAIDHGIEANTEDRISQGKPECGKLVLRAKADEEWALIELEDDGKGLDNDKIVKKALENGLIQAEIVNQLSDTDIQELILQPGFSTASKVSNLSGRGVGMDVVKTNLEKLGGALSISSEQGKGTRFSLKIPMTQTMVTKEAVIFEHNQEQYVLPSELIDKIINLSPEDVHHVDDDCFITFHDQVIALKHLSELIGSKDINSSMRENKIAIVLKDEKNQLTALAVDSVVKNQKVVIRKLNHPIFERNASIQGFTLLGTGKIALALNYDLVFESAMATT